MQQTPPAQPQRTYNPDSWHYEAGGKRLGPLTRQQVKDLVASGAITRETMVWRDGLKDWQRALDSPMAPLFQKDTSPPPLAASHVSNKFVWWLAFMPLIYAMVTTPAMVSMGQTTGAALLVGYGVPFALNTALCLLDQRAMHAAGHNTKGYIWLAVLLLPAYLFARAAKLKTGYGYAWVWMACFFVSIFIAVLTEVGRTVTAPQASTYSLPQSQVLSWPDDLKVTEVKQETTEGTFSSWPGPLTGLVTNAGNKTYESVVVTVTFYDATDAKVSEMADRCSGLSPNEKWRFSISSLGNHATKYKITMIEAVPVQ